MTKEPVKDETVKCTEGKWSYKKNIFHGGFCINAEGGSGIDADGNRKGLEVLIANDVRPEANAQRIVACVNACEGIETRSLEGLSFDILLGHSRDNVADLQAKLDEAESALKTSEKVKEELLGALRCANDCLGSFDPPEAEGEAEGFFEDLETISKAIKQAEGEG